MKVSKLLRLFKKDGHLFVTIRWKRLDASEDTDEPLKQVYEDVPKLLLRLLARKSSSSTLKTKLETNSGSERGECSLSIKL